MTYRELSERRYNVVERVLQEKKAVAVQMDGLCRIFVVIPQLGLTKSDAFINVYYMNIACVVKFSG